MWKYFKFITYITIVIIVSSFFINNSYLVNFIYRDFIIETNTSVLFIILLIIIFLFLAIQRIFFLYSKIKLNYFHKKKYLAYKKGHDAFLNGIVAVNNKDYFTAINESNKASKFLKDNSLSLILKAESLKVQNKNDDLYKVYETMLENENTNQLGLRGLMEQNLKAQDYHHAFVYGEKLFYKNSKIDKLYETIVTIIAKTNNWQKLVEITNRAFEKKIITKDKYSENKSIAFFEISKIKYLSSINESIKLIEQSLKLREYFQPYVSFYIKVLIEKNDLQKAKKYLIKCWSRSSHPNLINDIKTLSKAMKISFFELAKSCKSNNPHSYENILLTTESLIEMKKWTEAREEVKSLLNHRPNKEVCLLMSKIEEGDTNDPQKINAWINRSNYASLSKIWVCQISGLSQNQWSSISSSGYFNTLKWQMPDSDFINMNSKQTTNKSIENV